jgi:hypothetical protein
MKKKLHWGFIFCFLISQLVLFACPIDKPRNDQWKYKFTNQTDYSLAITLSVEYSTTEKKDGNKPSYSNETLYLSSNSSATIYIESGAVDFSWTASPVSNNRYIDTVVNGSTVTFKAR